MAAIDEMRQVKKGWYMGRRRDAEMERLVWHDVRTKTLKSSIYNMSIYYVSYDTVEYALVIRLWRGFHQQDGDPFPHENRLGGQKRKREVSIPHRGWVHDNRIAYLSS